MQVGAPAEAPGFFISSPSKNYYLIFALMCISFNMCDKLSIISFTICFGPPSNDSKSAIGCRSNNFLHSSDVPKIYLTMLELFLAARRYISISGNSCTIWPTLWDSLPTVFLRSKLSSEDPRCRLLLLAPDYGKTLLLG